jgi:hypothetical protein
MQIVKIPECGNANDRSEWRPLSLGALILEWLSPDSRIRGCLSEAGRLGRVAVQTYWGNPLAGSVLNCGVVEVFGAANCMVLDSGSNFLLYCHAQNALAIVPAFRVDDFSVGERLSPASFVTSILALSAARRSTAKTMMWLLGFGSLADELSGIQMVKPSTQKIRAVTLELTGG